MRRQNPPQASLDLARNIEKYLNPTTIAAVYALCAAVYCGYVALMLAVLLHEYILNPTPETFGMFAAIGIVPTAFAVLACKHRPSDPLSRFIRWLASLWRRPVNVAADQYTFKVLLMQGETLCINCSFYYPAKNHTAEVKDRLTNSVRAALEQDCSRRNKVPSDWAIEAATGPALEVLAAQYNIPVLYMEVGRIYKMLDAYSSSWDQLAPVEKLSTGTLG
jgi:hypothetical protein